MAFESYLQQGKLRPTRGRRITYSVSLVVHLVAVLVAVAYSFWHVEELTPPSVTVTFVTAAAAPPPPPPPPPLGGGAAAPKHKVAVRPKIEVAAKVPEVVQPKLEQKVDPVVTQPKEAPPSPVQQETKAGNTESPPGPGTASGVKNGVANGTKTGVVGGSGNNPAAPSKFLPPHMGEQQKLSGAKPDFPNHLATPGASYVILAKICVSISGAVDSVTLLKRAHPTLDSNVISTVKTWRFRPLMANGTPVPFCYPGQFAFASE